MYHLAILTNERYSIVYKNDCKDHIKECRVKLWKGYSFSILCDQKTSIDVQLEKLNKKVSKKFNISDISYTDIALYMLDNPEYRHTAIFKDKKKSLVHITNFCGTLTRLNLSGKFHTSTVPIIIGNEIEYLSIFTSKAM